MDLRVPEQEKAFRDEVRTFLEESLTPEIREAGSLVTSVFAPVKEAMAWQRIHWCPWACTCVAPA